jgi:hypothetical protein
METKYERITKGVAADINPAMDIFIETEIHWFVELSFYSS